MADGTQIYMEIEIGKTAVKLCSKLSYLSYLPILQSTVASILQ
jgi:hypothetical protein